MFSILAPWAVGVAVVTLLVIVFAFVIEPAIEAVGSFSESFEEALESMAMWVHSTLMASLPVAVLVGVTYGCYRLGVLLLHLVS